MITITRRFQFAAGHRVYGHESKCANLHGHNYVAFITVTGPKLDPQGRVVDFDVIKTRFGQWIDHNWDHGFLVYFEDPVKYIFRELEMLSHMKYFICEFNPTAELMAECLLKRVGPELFYDTPLTVTKVVIQETENCSAEVTLDGVQC